MYKHTCTEKWDTLYKLTIIVLICSASLFFVWCKFKNITPNKKTTPWKKILFTNNTKAICLDGSPGGFYYRAGKVNKWLVFHQGGGWCSSHDECRTRARSNLGTTL